MFKHKNEYRPSLYDPLDRDNNKLICYQYEWMQTIVQKCVFYAHIKRKPFIKRKYLYGKDILNPAKNEVIRLTTIRPDDQLPNDVGHIAVIPNAHSLDLHYDFISKTWLHIGKIPQDYYILFDRNEWRIALNEEPSTYSWSFPSNQPAMIEQLLDMAGITPEGVYQISRIMNPMPEAKTLSQLYQIPTTYV